MNIHKFAKTIYQALDKQGIRARIVSASRMAELKSEIESKYHNGLIDEMLYKEFLIGFDDDAPHAYSAMGSLIIVASSQPNTKVTFNLHGKSFRCLIPSTYVHDTDAEAEKILAGQLNPLGFNVHQVIVPNKLLAVRSGLARYGRNNITYVDGMGSLYRLSAFLSDLPCPGDCWTEPQMHDRCDDCSICLRACPTDAIPQHRFLLHAERCITFHNETRGPFPPWLDPSWHNCLVGCLHCQRVCPLNSGLLKKVKQGPVFTHAETASLLEKHPTERISPRTTTKLKKLDLLEYGDVLGRNLKALMTKYSVPGFPSTD